MGNAGDLGLFAGPERSPGEENGYPLQYSCLENPMDGEPGRLQSMGSLSTGHEAGGLVLSLGQVESEQPLGLSSRVVQKII